MKRKKYFRKRLTLGDYSTRLFKGSILTGVPQILACTNFRRYWKILVLAACLTGFCYQMGSFLALYRKHPILEEVDIYFPNDVEFPAISICNYNGLNRKKYCDDHPNNCETPRNIDEFCSVFRHSCLFIENKEDIKIPKPDYSLLEENAPRELVMKYGQKEDLLHSCTLIVADKREPCPNMTGRFVNFYENIPRICHTFNGRYRYAKDLPVLMVDNEFTVMTLLLDLRGSDYFRPDRPVLGYMAIHPPTTILNPFDVSMLIEEGRTYDIRPSEKIVKYLPAPYRTNCSDNVDLPHGLGTLEGCIDHCIFTTYYEKCGCVKGLLVLPDERRFCVKEDEDCIKSVNVNVCYDRCSRPCRITSYDNRLDEYQVRGFKFKARTPEEWINNREKDQYLVTVRIIIQHPQRTIIAHKPKYQMLELFSLLGGYIGVWLGMSLIALIDFIEMIFMVIMFSIKNASIKKRRKERMIRISDLNRFPNKNTIICHHRHPVVEEYSRKP